MSAKSIPGISGRDDDRHHDRAMDLENEEALNAAHSDDEGDADADEVEVLPNGKRKRPMSVSCELCKQRKVKCDRNRPSCGWCFRNNQACEYKERKRPGLRAGYGRELEQRMERLEEIVRAHSELLQVSCRPSTSPRAGRLGSAASIHGGSTGSNHDALLSPHAPAGSSSDQTTAFAPPAAVLESGPGPINAYGHAPYHRDSIHSDSIHRDSIHRDSIHRDSIHRDSIPRLPPMQQNIGTPKLFNQPHMQSPSLVTTVTDQDLPPYDLLYGLVDLYFKHIYPWCPILHKKNTLDSLFMSPTLGEADRILLHAIVATTLRYSADPRLTDEKRRHYHDVSKQKVLLYGMENSSVRTLQALVILALDLVGSSNGPPGWNIMALITRSVVHLGLSVESTSLTVSPNVLSIYTLRAMLLPEPRDFEEEESRRRLFWMVYVLDRYATIATAFEFALDDREIDRTLPCRDDLWLNNHKVDTRHFRTHGSPTRSQGPSEFGPDRPENLGAFSYYIEVLGILSKIHRFLKEPVNIAVPRDVERWQARYVELDTMLSTWKESLPREYSDVNKPLFSGGRPLGCNWLMLHVTIHTVVIRLHSSAAYPTTRSELFKPSLVAIQRCNEAVEHIYRIGKIVVDHGMLVRLGPPFAFSLWVAARLLLVHSSTLQNKLSRLIHFFVDTLHDMGDYWPVAARYNELLVRVLDEYSHSDGIIGNAMKILADMRRTAFDLDFLISRQPRQVTEMRGGVGMMGIGGGVPLVGRFPSIAPARTPAPNELELFDVFGFFNVPRLPYNVEAMAAGFQSDMSEAAGGQAAAMVSEAGGPSGGAPMHSNEFNITNFALDVNSDWLFKREPEAAKFMGQGSHGPSHQ